MNRIIQGIQQFQRDIFPTHRELFRRLAFGQQPEALFIACSDSRVSLEWITQCAPGDLFVCRNPGNMAPPYGPVDAVSATIEYAVCALKVRHIVVFGHSDCGAMKGLLDPAALTEMPDVSTWLRNAKNARGVLEASQVPPDGPDAVIELAKINIRVQLEHLRTHPQVISRVEAQTLELHGWFYRIESGDVLAWDPKNQLWGALELTPQPIAEAQHV